MFESRMGGVAPVLWPGSQDGYSIWLGSVAEPQSVPCMALHCHHHMVLVLALATCSAL